MVKYTLQAKNKEIYMNQKIEIVNDQMQVILTGNIFVEEAKKIKEALIELINKGQISILLDLSQVDYFECVGMGMLVAIQKRAVQCGGSIKIKGIQRLLKKQFELNYLTKVFEIQ
jgi:anti-sigma B factor antagonist